MNFLTPAAFALAALLPIIVVMYLLKLRRTEQVVSSVYLWKRMVRDVEANAPWQRLRKNILMFLQLLFLALLIFALAQPFTWTEGATGQAVILIIDNSASMASRDAVPNRLDAAKEQARQMVSGLPDDARVTVMSTAHTPQVLAASSQDRRQVYQAIESIRQSAGSSNMVTALGLAAAIASRQQDTEVLVFSDGRAEMPDRLAIKGRLRYLPIGLSGDNQSISLLTLESGALGTGMTAFAQVTNFGDQPANRRLELYADGRLVNAYDLQINPGEQAAVIADDLPLETQMIEARLQGVDVLPLDDLAWAVRREYRPVEISLISQGNLFLRTALSLLPSVKVVEITPEEFEAGIATPPVDDTNGVDNRSALEPINLTIFDGYVPTTAPLPDGSLLFIAPPRSTDYFTVHGLVEGPVPRIVDHTDPLAAHLNLAEVNILDTVQVSLPPWARQVISGDASETSTPLLLVGQPEGRRMAVLAFDIRRSDLPLQIAFPLLMANLTGWLAPGRSGELPKQINPGAAISLAMPPEASNATVTRPDGTRLQTAVEQGRLTFSDTYQLGVYQVRWGQEGQASFAVNLFSPQESNVKPEQSLELFSASGEAEGERAAQGRREWWRPFAFIALCFLFAEWLVYNRANLVRVMNSLKLRSQPEPTGRGRWL
jgi:Ca-activated chloride channel homolog